jgi:hypothetical protein
MPPLRARFSHWSKIASKPKKSCKQRQPANAKYRTRFTPVKKFVWIKFSGAGLSRLGIIGRQATALGGLAHFPEKPVFFAA